MRPMNWCVPCALLFWCWDRLLARFGRATCPLPGGCAIGSRPVNLHIDGLRAMGPQWKLMAATYEPVANGPLTRLVLDIVTVTGTENLMMAATLARGETRIENAAREPEVVDLANCLIAMGAKSMVRNRFHHHRGGESFRDQLSGFTRSHRNGHLSGGSCTDQWQHTGA